MFIKNIIKIITILSIICILLSCCVYFLKNNNGRGKTTIHLGQEGIIQITNYGKESADFGMKFNGMFFSSDEDILRFIVSMKSEYSGEPFYRKTWRFIKDYTYNFHPFTGDQWQHSPSIFINSIGFGYCDDVAALFANILTHSGYNTRIWALNGHIVAEVFVNNKWEMYDPDFGVYYINDQDQVASVEELVQNPQLITNPIKPVLDPKARAYSHSLANIYSTQSDNQITDWYRTYPDVNLKFTVPSKGQLYFPTIFAPDLKSMNGNLVPLYSNMKLIIPSGWTGDVDIPLVIQTIKGSGMISLHGETFEVGSNNLQDKLEKGDNFYHQVKILSSQGNVEIIYLVNPKLFTMKPINTMVLEGKNIAMLTSSKISYPQTSNTMSIVVWLVLLGCILLALCLTGSVRKYVIRKNIMDVPNARSSHTGTVPRGGGAAIVATFYLGLIVMLVCELVSVELVLSLAGGVVVAAAGWIDDRKGLSPNVRIIVHFAAAIWALYWLNGFPSLNIGHLPINLELMGVLIGSLIIVWMINLYNFMDGIDGLAGTEAIFVAIIIGILSLIIGFWEIAVVCFLLAAAVSGFVYWNWPPAKIFMGDVGSGFLGFIFGVLMISSENSGSLPLIVWVLLLLVFIVDATATLIKRIMNREKWYEAHRTHVYQLAIQAGYTHKRVTLTVVGINILLSLVVTFIYLYQPQWMMMEAFTIITVLVLLHSLLRKKYKRIITGRVNSFISSEDSILQAAAERDRLE